MAGLLSPDNVTWHLVPLAVIVSLVYSATWYEMPERIVRRAARLFFWIMVVMILAIVLLAFLSFGL